MLEIGSVIDGKYRILSIIGRGGMSTVYLAINEKANKPWAIKEVRKDVVQNFDIIKQSLIVETDLLKKLKHQNLPSIVDIIDQDDNFLIVMDYIEGITLDKVVAECGQQKQEDVVSWAIQLCDVLHYLHTREPSIIYRDMKPSNVMLKYDGSVVLIDFGTAREYKEKSIEDTTSLGTQGYAAPEQFGYGFLASSEKSDIYAVGMILNVMITGKMPKEEKAAGSVWNIIEKCISLEPKMRYTAEELIAALERV